MRIRDLTVYSVRIPFKKKVTHASHSRTETESLVVRCRLDDGTLGWGEGLPRPYVTGENLSQALELLQRSDLKTALGGEWSDLSSALQRLGSFDVARRPEDRRRCFGNSLRCALELSVLDALCRSFQTPLSAVTAIVAPTVAQRPLFPQVRYSGAITATSIFKQFVRCLLFRLSGFQQVKVKVGVAGVNDVALLQRMRRFLGSKIDLRIDANEAWTCANLLEQIEPLRRFRISAIEQPVPHAAVDGLAALRAELGIPILLDESLCSEIDARHAIERGTCDLFNLRLSKCGGFLPTLQLAALARQAGLGYQLGCQVGETGILSAAGRHFATSVRDIRYLEGSFDRYLVAERLTVEDLTFSPGGLAPALTQPGLGITIDPAALERVTFGEVRVEL